jgi:hypothetical protein
MAVRRCECEGQVTVLDGICSLCAGHLGGRNDGETDVVTFVGSVGPYPCCTSDLDILYPVHPEHP